MAFIVDYSNDYLFIDGVEAATYTPDGESAQNVHALPDALTRNDFNGASLQVSPKDTVFIVWGISGDPSAKATLTVDGTTYMVRGSLSAADDSQHRLICRRQV